MKFQIKKTIIILVIILIICGCGKKTIPTDIDSPAGNTELKEYEYNYIYGALGENFKFEEYDKLTEEEKSKIISYAAKFGQKIEIKNNKMNIILDQPERPTETITPWEETELSKVIPRTDQKEMYGTINTSDENEIIYRRLTESEANDYVSGLSTQGWEQIDYTDSYRDYIYVGTKGDYTLKVDYVEKLLRINIKIKR